MPTSSPFPTTTSKPGHGKIHLSLLPPSTPVFKTLSFTYPLKLINSTPHTIPPAPPTSPLPHSENDPQSGDSPKDLNNENTHPPRKAKEDVPTASKCPLLFLLTYGGGLLAGDHINLILTLDAGTRLCITTQGMGKIFRPREPLATTTTKGTTTLSSPATTTSSSSAPTTSSAPATTTTSSQSLTCTLHPHSALWLAPDPSQPFASSQYTQLQRFYVELGASVGVVDWVHEGRSARGERWDCRSWSGRNEIIALSPSSGGADAEAKDTGVEEGEGEGKKKRRLLIRDALLLAQPGLRNRMANTAIVGTILLHGPLFASLGQFFKEEFEKLPRIGGRDWDGEGVDGGGELTARERWRKERQEKEGREVVSWTACHVRDCTVVKFMAVSYQVGREWVGGMVRKEGTVGREFGVGGLMFVR